MGMHQSLADEGEALERIRWDRLKAARHAYTCDVLSNVIAALPNERIPG